MQPASVRFDPLHLIPEATLNRTRIADLPGAVAEWVGQSSGELLRLGALEALATQLGFTPTSGHRDIARALAKALAAPTPAAHWRSGAQPADPGTESVSAEPAHFAAAGEPGPGADQASQRAVALRVVEIFGGRLAHLIATLTSGRASPAAVDGHAEWRAAYLAHWTGVERMWLGGGVAAALGAHLLDATREELARLDQMSVTCATTRAGVRASERTSRKLIVELAPHPDVLPLVGAARTVRRRSTPGAPTVPAATQPSSRLVLDFGHSAAKRAIASVSGDRLSHLAVLPSRPTAWITEAGVVEFVIDTIADTRRTVAVRTVDIDPEILVSVATYISSDGMPAESPSLYAPLRSVGLAAVDAALLDRTGAALRVSLVHDGTAAARAVVSGDGSRDAVIMLGTALGVGFSPGNRSAAMGLLELSPDFVLDRW